MQRRESYLNACNEATTLLGNPYGAESSLARRPCNLILDSELQVVQLKASSELREATRGST